MPLFLSPAFLLVFPFLGAIKRWINEKISWMEKTHQIIHLEAMPARHLVSTNILHRQKEKKETEKTIEECN
ncbi:hypothetical protein EUGRSUZ_K02847 [Eucalyptus grandis]|uniref:Uncharacterized protein n=2 Tax=Eucalyptus grandis TaxID=71139 RepID=A0ACC3IYP2_EUCGR|nr:hypothetical protein EUGRSUZ_K02847 [Eucalyptus grandis]